MSTSTQTGTTKAKANTTKANAKSTTRSAAATARSASATTRRTTTKASKTTRREARKTERGVRAHSRRVVGAAQAEVSAVAAQPTRPLFFALGVVDRTAAGVRTVPSTLTSAVTEAPARTRARVVDVFATAGDLAERAQQSYTDLATGGEKLVRSVRRQDSTKRAVHLADRAQDRASRAIGDAEKAVDAGTDAAVEAVSKLG